MDALEFERKLKKLNSRLYVSKIINWDYHKELGTVGIYYKDHKDGEDIDLSEVNKEDFATAKKMNESCDLYVAFCTYKYVPEGNSFDEKMHIKAPGWREILIRLSRATDKRPALLNLEKARKVFRADVGKSTYDTLPLAEKFRRQYPHTKKKKYN